MVGCRVRVTFWGCDFAYAVFIARDEHDGDGCLYCGEADSVNYDGAACGEWVDFLTYGGCAEFRAVAVGACHNTKGSAPHLGLACLSGAGVTVCVRCPLTGGFRGVFVVAGECPLGEVLAACGVVVRPGWESCPAAVVDVLLAEGLGLPVVVEGERTA